MMLKEFLEQGSVCKLCNLITQKDIVVRTNWETTAKAKLNNNEITFSFGSKDAHENFIFYIDSHEAKREIINPKSWAMMFCNNFTFTVICESCKKYSFSSNSITYHPMGTLTTNVYLHSEEIYISDRAGQFYKIKNNYNINKTSICHGIMQDPRKIAYLQSPDSNEIKIDLIPFDVLPTNDKNKMLKKIRTLMLLS